MPQESALGLHSDQISELPNRRQSMRLGETKRISGVIDAGIFDMKHHKNNSLPNIHFLLVGVCIVNTE